MKRQLVVSFAILLAVMAVSTASAQEFPRGDFIFEPGSRGPDGKVSHFILNWEEANLIAYADSKDSVTNMFLTFKEKLGDGKFHMPEVPVLGRFHDFPAKDKKRGFKDLEKWKTFAEKQMRRIVVIDHEKYADSQSWEFIGTSQGSMTVISDLGQRNTNILFYVFKGDHVILIPEKNWLGEQPSSNRGFLGRIDDTELYFPVIFSCGKPSIDFETAKILANREKDIAETSNAKK